MLENVRLPRGRRHAVVAYLPRVLLSLACLCIFLYPRPSFGGGATPVVTAVSPASAPEGTLVTITGTSFNNATAVHFGTVSAAFTFISATTITATVPAGASGSVDVTVTALFVGTSATNPSDVFTFATPSVSAPALGMYSTIALGLLLACFGWYALRRKFA